MKQWLALSLLLSSLSHAAQAAPPVGRLFMTPEERRQIDLHPERTDALGNGLSKSNKGDEDQITVNGLVTRNNGKRTVWINQQPLQEGQAAASARPLGIPKPATVELALPGQTNTQLIKAGQSFDQISGSITESFNKKAPPSTATPLTSSNQPNSPNSAINPNDFIPPIISAIGKGNQASIPGKTAIPLPAAALRK